MSFTIHATKLFADDGKLDYFFTHYETKNGQSRVTKKVGEGTLNKVISFFKLLFR